jgi:hypothetical protein
LPDAAFEVLDNGIKSCADPGLMPRLSDGLSADRINRLLRKWLRRLPHRFPERDRAAGYRYRLSILQAEFTLSCRWRSRPQHHLQILPHVARIGHRVGNF